jgi:hypothetical protein
MSLDDRELALLVSISNEIAAMRSDIKTLHAGLVRIGAIVPKKAESLRNANSWEPPAIRRLGTLMTIIAQSNPASARFAEEIGRDTELDPRTDPEVDPQDTDKANGTDVRDGADPRLRDADRTPRNWWPTWLGGDIDPVKKDLVVTRRNSQDVADPAPDGRDDNNDVQPKPDTARDNPETMAW